jgi:hypothetical protein
VFNDGKRLVLLRTVPLRFGDLSVFSGNGDGAIPMRRAQAPPDFVVKLFQMIQNEDPQLISWDDGRSRPVFVPRHTGFARDASAECRCRIIICRASNVIRG